MWTYSQASGNLFHDGELITTGYSGHEDGVNNPDMEKVKGIGPMPKGHYVIGPAYKHPELGPHCMNLEPKEGTETFGRGDFRIHADSIENFGKKQASHGCIIIAKQVRQELAKSEDRDLEITL